MNYGQPGAPPSTRPEAAVADVRYHLAADLLRQPLPMVRAMNARGRTMPGRRSPLAGSGSATPCTSGSESDNPGLSLEEPLCVVPLSGRGTAHWTWSRLAGAQRGLRFVVDAATDRGQSQAPV